MFSCKYGTFLGDCEKDRRGFFKPLCDKTPSFWSEILQSQNQKRFINESFKAFSDTLSIRDSIVCVELWLPFYRRWDASHHYFDFATVDDSNSSLKGFCSLHLIIFYFRSSDCALDTFRSCDFVWCEFYRRNLFVRWRKNIFAKDWLRSYKMVAKGRRKS